MKKLLSAILVVVMAAASASFVVSAEDEFVITDGVLEKYNGTSMDGYEIHAGQSVLGKGAQPWLRTTEGTDGIMNAGGNVLGSYLHGIFDDGKLFAAMASRIREQRGETGKESIPVSFEAFREKEFNRIAAIVRSSVDMEKIYGIMRGEDRK